ncbi:MAG: LysM peptidoglycan-binding domain-containing protein [Bacillota bacterium]
MALGITLSVSFCGQARASVYTVQSGDSLWQIGSWYGVSADNIQRANNLKDSVIVPGQRLYIPDDKTWEYTVKPGDTLYKIAMNNGTTVSQLMSDNGLKGDLIYPGQKLYLRGAVSYQPAGGQAAGVSRGGVSASEFDYLARIITAEADNQSYEAKVAVGATVLNRVKSPLFPDTIREVVNQVDSGGRYQFEPVLNGWINRPPSESAIKAAQDALNGWDPTGGALYFWESWVQNSFLNSRPVARVIGAFTFTY